MPPPLRILVVEDDPNLRRFVTVALSDEGYEVAAAADGASALEMAAAAPVDLILSDLQMPVMDGAALLDAYHQLPQPHAPFLVMTAAPSQAPLLTLVKAAALLIKPFDMDLLLDTIMRRLRLPDGALVITAEQPEATQRQYCGALPTIPQ
ncbi:MAG: response regulator [Chloroflexi bacterium]|nr:response regulator [Chloroflexota bacterium]